MSDKYNKTINLQQFKEQLKLRLFEVGGKIDSFDRMQIAINLRIDIKTVRRYMDDDIKELRRLELAEQILAEAQTIAATKSSAATA